jgi:thioredoxin reductase (NADPH)
MLVRGPGLATSMSRYLIDRIEATPNIELRPHTAITALHGDPAEGLTAVSWHDHRAGNAEKKPLRNLFLFVGADPETGWMAGCEAAVDPHGFVLTGEAAGPRNEGPVASALETSIPGVFAVGDVRSGSVKRVGGAIGEGAAVVAQIHRHLERDNLSL